MHPALSIIAFTTLSGIGYGLLFWLGMLSAAALLPLNFGFGVAAFVLALATISTGLLSSTAHLGHPERAWRALSQWRSSWLSREAVAALFTYIPACLLAFGWILPGRAAELRDVVGPLTAIGAVATVTCTAFIYRSLKPIRAWDNHWVVPNYLALAAMTGALWLTAIDSVLGASRLLVSFIALSTIVIAGLLKLFYWHAIDKTTSASTIGTATGLDVFGDVQPFEAPHTSENYLLKEMGFRIARKHAAKLRKIAIVMAFALPLILIAISFNTPSWLGTTVLFIAAPIATFGVAVERWLFFAEAKHTVTLYYGAMGA